MATGWWHQTGVHSVCGQRALKHDNPIYRQTTTSHSHTHRMRKLRRGFGDLAYRLFSIFSIPRSGAHQTRPLRAGFGVWQKAATRGERTILSRNCTSTTRLFNVLVGSSLSMSFNVMRVEIVTRRGVRHCLCVAVYRATRQAHRAPLTEK